MGGEGGARRGDVRAASHHQPPVRIEVGWRRRCYYRCLPPRPLNSDRGRASCTSSIDTEKK